MAGALAPTEGTMAGALAPAQRAMVGTIAPPGEATAGVLAPAGGTMAGVLAHTGGQSCGGQDGCVGPSKGRAGWTWPPPHPCPTEGMVDSTTMLAGHGGTQAARPQSPPPPMRLA